MKIETRFGIFDIFLKQDNRVKKSKIKIDENGYIFFIYKKKSIFFTFFVKNFIKTNSEWIYKSKKKILENRAKSEKRIKIKISREFYLKNKEEFRVNVKKRIDYFNKYYNFDFNKISIKNQKTRWGSCSSNKNLNFNISIMRLPEELQDLIFVHELCHLEEMNHGKRF
jgi:predicted metal-dependent hydrolase